MKIDYTKSFHAQSNVSSAAKAIQISLTPQLAHHVADVLGHSSLGSLANGSLDLDKLAELSPLAAARLVLAEQVRDALKKAGSK